MDIRQIEFFVVLARELNFTRAAEQSHVSQSGLSSSIRSLERELRHPLFERSSRSVALTAAGAAFLPRARRILADTRAAHRDLARADGVAGSLGVGAEQCLGDLVDLPEMLGAFRARYPGVAMRFEQAGPQTLRDALERGELEVALLAEPGRGTPPWAGAASSDEVARDGFELIVAAGHPLAERSAVSWSDLEEYPSIDLATDWTARRIVDRAFARRGLARRSGFVVNDVHMLLDLVHGGFGPALVPAPFAAKPQAEGLVRHAFADDDLSWVVHLVTAGESVTARLFADLLLTADTVAALRDHLDAPVEVVGRS